MKRIVLTVACALASGFGGLALAQQSPNMQPSPPPSSEQAPPAQMPPDTQSSSSSTTTTTTTTGDKHAQMKECMAQQEQQKGSTGMSKHDMKKYCKNEVKSATQTQPH